MLSNLADAATPTDAQPGFFPALTHFSDAIDALPREMIRHFSMMMEVDAKLDAPDEELAKLADQVARLPQPSRRAASFAADSAQPNGDTATTPWDQSSDELPEAHRLPLYRRLNWSIHTMAPILDEKIAVLSTANAELSRMLERIESSFRYVPEEVSREVRLGSTTHWAYVAEKEPKKTGNERTRREVAAVSNYGAGGTSSHEADLAAARSEARRDAVTARKNRNQVQDSDFEERTTVRRPKGKSAKHLDVLATAASRPGDTASASGPIAPVKRKKPAATAQPMERSVSAALGGQKRPTGSPTPVAEASRKRKAAPGAAPAKKRYVTTRLQNLKCLGDLLMSALQTTTTVNGREITTTILVASYGYF
jgi:hypothetical protein